MGYRYILEKYSGRASRYTCPRCGGRHEFTRYIDAVTGEALSPVVGKCNHESSCGYHYTPREWFADNPEMGVVGSTERIAYTPARRPKVVVPKPVGTIDRRYLDRSMGLESDFATWLSQYFTAEMVRRVAGGYALGHTRDGRVIFWQQDITGRIRTGQVMRYNPRIGRRVKGMAGAMDWIHAMLKRRGELPDDFNLRQCLFGEHLLARWPDAIVVLVESAKSAVVSASFMPWFVWLATNGKAGFSAERCRALARRKVIVIPDLDAHADWSAKAPAIALQVGCEIAVSDFLVRHCTADHCDTGYDIADYIIDQLDDAVPSDCLADKLSGHLETYFIPERLHKLIAGCLKEPFKKIEGREDGRINTILIKPLTLNDMTQAQRVGEQRQTAKFNRMICGISKV